LDPPGYTMTFVPASLLHSTPILTSLIRYFLSPVLPFLLHSPPEKSPTFSGECLMSSSKIGDDDIWEPPLSLFLFWRVYSSDLVTSTKTCVLSSRRHKVHFRVFGTSPRHCGLASLERQPISSHTSRSPSLYLARRITFTVSLSPVLYFLWWIQPRDFPPWVLGHFSFF